jgi:dienelactone hydrolase
MNARLDALSDDLDRLRSIGRAGLEVLVAEPRTDPSRVAAVGYCYGGTVVLELVRGGAQLRAVVGFHPGLDTTRPEDARNITGAVLVCIGTEDPFIPLETRLAFEQEMRTAGVDWRMNLYGGAEHSFTHPWANRQIAGLKYDAKTDERSWRAMLDLLSEVFEAAAT